MSCLPLVFLVAFISCAVHVFGDATLSGASQISLLSATAVCLGLGLVLRLVTWRDVQFHISQKIGGIGEAVFVLLLIGALSGAWMVSGIVPMFIYYGMELMNPQWFLITACLVCAMVSVMTGSSWTTIATMGVAILGIGRAMGFSDGWIAGAIISGAYFGDKVSPLSDTTVLASSTVGVPLFTHIRYMMFTTIPTFLVALVIYLIVGLRHDGMDSTQIVLVQDALQHTFHLSLWLFLVPVLTILLIAKRVPSLVVLFLATLLGVVASILFQSELLIQIAGDTFSGAAQIFRGAMIQVFGATDIDTGLSTLNDLVATRGMSGMMDTIWLILCATLFGAAMTATRMVDSIIRCVLRLVRGTASLVASSAFSGIFLNIVCADQYLSIVLTANMFHKLYQDSGHEDRLLSRTCEDSATVTSVLIPWNTCGMTQSTVLGVSTLCYAPYCFFCYLSPLTTILVAALGWKIVRNPVCGQMNENEMV